MKLQYDPFDEEHRRMWGPPGFWGSSANHALVRMEDEMTYDRLECWYPDCEELAVATYVDRNMFGHKYCAKHIAAYYNHLTNGDSYCVHRIPHNWMLWDVLVDILPTMIHSRKIDKADLILRPSGIIRVDDAEMVDFVRPQLPYCLPVGKCTFFPRGISNARRETHFPDKHLKRMEWQRDNEVYHNCGCDGQGRTFDGVISYTCVYADITDPVREKAKAEMKAKFAKKIKAKQMSLFGGK